MKNVIFAMLSLSTLFACNQPENETAALKEQPKLKTGVIELTSFKLNKGVASSDFIKSATQMQDSFLVNQAGFIKRTLTNSGDTLWTDIVYWENEVMQSNAMKIAEKSTQIMPFMEKIDFNSVKMTLTKPVFSTE
jgi:hypothetical protein